MHVPWSNPRLSRLAHFISTKHACRHWPFIYGVILISMYPYFFFETHKTNVEHKNQSIVEVENHGPQHCHNICTNLLKTRNIFIEGVHTHIYIYICTMYTYSTHVMFLSCVPCNSSAVGCTLLGCQQLVAVNNLVRQIRRWSQDHHAKMIILSNNVWHRPF